MSSTSRADLPWEARQIKRLLFNIKGETYFTIGNMNILLLEKDENMLPLLEYKKTNRRAHLKEMDQTGF
jgi:hypothetical protein